MPSGLRAARASGWKSVTVSGNSMHVEKSVMRQALGEAQRAKGQGARDETG